MPSLLLPPVPSRRKCPIFKPVGMAVRRQVGNHAHRDRFATVAVILLPSLHMLLCVVLAAREWRARWAPAYVNSAPPAGAPGRVPKIIHQMYKNAELPAKWRRVPDAWTALHPPSEYTYVLWTDDQLRGLIEREYPWLLSTYDAYPYATQRWDASRLAVLHKYAIMNPSLL